jgi:HlyD family secretion protein
MTKSMPLLSKKSLVIVSAAAVVLAVAVYFWQEGRQSQPRWVTAAVDQGSIVQRVSANGTLNPVELVNVGTQISGTVRSLLVDFNSQVKAGQLLAELDPSILEAQIRASEASLAAAKATLRNAELILKRNENLKNRGFVSEGALDGLRKDVDTAAAQVLQIEAQLSRDRTNLGYSKIRSPIDGIVVNRGIDVGQTVAASFQTPTLFQIARDLTRMQIFTSVSEADVGAIVPRLPVRFTVDAFRDREFEARVRMVRLNPTNVQNVVTYNVVIEVDNKDGVLLPGMTAQVAILTSRRDDVLRVPSAALRFRPPEEANSEGPSGQGNRRVTGLGAGVARVFVESSKGELEPREIKIGISDGRFVEVIEGLAIGERVVTRSISAANSGPVSGFRFKMF